METAIAAHAFRTIFEHCLDLSPGSDLLIIYDESFEEFLPAAKQAIEEAKLFAVFALVTRAQQERTVAALAREREGFIRLPGALEAAIGVSSSILNVLGPDLSTSAFRKAVVQARSETGRIAHVPGMSEEVLRVMLDTPVGIVEKACEALAWALGEARQALVQTTDRAGHVHELSLRLDGWENEPLVSPGIIAPGSWGNIPPGETFCCPDPASVQGTICINGSVPLLAFDETEEVILTFKDGKMAWDSPRGSRIDDFFESEKRRASANPDDNWNTFAELGIGLNPAIRRLTGNSLFDEKAAETLHIAVGDNSVFGHDVLAKTHADLVTHRPTLLLDGHVVLDRGKLSLSEIDRRRLTAAPRKAPVPDDALIEIDEQRCCLREGRLCRRLTSGHRTGYVEIAPRETAERAGRFYTELRTFGTESLEVIRRQIPVFEEANTDQLIDLFYHYRLLKVRLRHASDYGFL